MPTPHLTIAIASSALFDLGEADAVFRSEGREAYRAYQRNHEREILQPGVAFPFVRRLLAVNGDNMDPLVEVVLLSRNDPDTGLRVRNSLDHYNLSIPRDIFTGGRSPWPYIDVFEASLFLSGNRDDVAEAIAAGYPAGVVMPGHVADDEDDHELRLGFDFDGVLADDAGERLYKEQGLAQFHASERDNAERAMAPGPMQRLLTQVAAVQRSERERCDRDPTYKPLIRTAIITARSAPADRRVIASLRAWGVNVDEAFFIGNLPKDRVLRRFRPQLFFDDKPENAQLAATTVPTVHVPFGVTNEQAP